MKGLILNDLLSIRRMLKTLAGIFLVFMVAWAVGGQPATGAMMLCIMGASYILNLFSYDEFYHWEKYLRVLPVSTKQVVLSRYATFGIMASATAVISLVYLLVLNTPMQEILSVLLMTVVLNVYFAAVMIPVAYKWGVQKGRLIFMLVLGVSSGTVCGRGLYPQPSGQRGGNRILLQDGAVGYCRFVPASGFGPAAVDSPLGQDCQQKGVVKISREILDSSSHRMTAAEAAAR